MKLEQFYQKYANVLFANRFDLLSNDYTSPLLGMTLSDVRKELEEIDEKIRSDLIRQEELLSAVERLWLNRKKTAPQNKIKGRK